MKGLYLVLFSAGMLLCNTPAWTQSQPADPGAALSKDNQTQVWTGSLFDAACKSTDAAKPCEVSESTTSFGLQTANGDSFMLDASGNSKVRNALQAKNKTTGPVTVSLKASADGKTLKVDSVQITD